MSPGPERQTSRRSALQGIGMAAGVAALGVGGDWDGALAEPTPADLTSSDGAPWDGTGRAPLSTGAPAAVTPGLSFRTYGQFAFQPTVVSNGYTTSSTGCYCSNLAGWVVTNLDLPSGTILKEIFFEGLNTSGTPADFFIERYPISTGSQGRVGTVSFPSVSSLLQSGSVAVNHVIDPEYVYSAACYSSSNVRMYACRVGCSGPLGLFPLTTQVRKLDTRNPGPLTGKFLSGQTRDLGLGPEVPAGAHSALINITITNSVNAGFLTLFKTGSARPSVSHINWFGSGQTLANNATIPVSGTSMLSIYCGGSASPQTDVIVDLLGYYR